MTYSVRQFDKLKYESVWVKDYFLYYIF